MKRFLSSLWDTVRLLPFASFAAALVLSSGLSVAGARTADPVQEEFVAACSADLQRNNPMWIQEQRREICLCRYAKLNKDFSPRKIRALSQAVLTRYRDVSDDVDRQLLSSYAESASGCAPRR